MTDPSEVTISDAEVRRLLLRLGVHDNAASEIVARHALAAFLAARVPEKVTVVYAGQWPDDAALRFNACRDDVLLAAKVKK
jgi:hypothetical protein